MANGVKVGLQLQAVNPKFWVAASQEAEQAGFESVWVPEHLVLPVKMSGSPYTGHAEVRFRRACRPTTCGSRAMVAASTSTSGSARTCTTSGSAIRSSPRAAVATLDVFSGGRVEFGIGARWLEEEWDAMQLDFATRG